MAEDFLASLRNVARGRLQYRLARHRIFDAAHRHGGRLEYELTGYLRDDLFKLRKDWFALAFDDKDWRTLEIIRSDRTGHWVQLYLPMVLDYVSSNAEKVSEVAARSIEIGAAMLIDDGPAAQRVLSEMGPQEEQSLFAFRVQSAQFSFDADASVALLRSKLKTDWLRKRYLYPLVFQAFAMPSQDGLDDFLSFVVTGEEPEAERAALRFLLRDDLIGSEGLAFKCYIALLCHPFDAYEILLNHIEEVLCTTGNLSPTLMDALSRLASEVPTSRSDRLVRIAIMHDVPFQQMADADRLERALSLEPTTAAALASLTATLPDTDLGTADLPKPMAALMRMRRTRYPIPDDFNYLVSSGRSWWFCDAGRLLNAVLASLYMFARGDPIGERRDLLRLVGFFGGISPFLMTAPAAGSFSASRYDGLWNGRSYESMEAEVDAFVRPAVEYDDRMWMKAAHWELRESERELHIGRWLRIVRRNIRIAPAFLTGIDWSWLEGVIKVSRLAPFVGNPDGLYALLLFKIEERDRRSAALRTAFEPIAEGRALPEVVDWLIEEYGEEAIAFARYLLEVDDLLWLGLAPNRTAALAGRIYALERCVRQFRYTDLLPEPLFRQEWETLNSALLLSSVNAGQFEIPWTVFIRDAAAKQHDLYTAAHSLEPSDATAAMLASSRITMPYRYRNDRIVTYVYPHRLAPVVALIIAIVEDFLAHPAFGLEMILSTRFRHDTMRREFAAVLEGVSAMSLTNVWPDERREIIESIEKSVLSEVDAWLEDRMHTARPRKPDALFDVVPAADEMAAFADRLQVSAGVDQVISEIVEWIRGRLDQQLPIARRTYEAELPGCMMKRLADERSRLLEVRVIRAASVDKVVGAARHALAHRAGELIEWFKGDPVEVRPPLTFGEIKMAADGLFEAYKERRGYRTILHEATSAERQISSEKVRLIFDLLREVFASALAHSDPYRARTRMRPATIEDADGMIFSNLVDDGQGRSDRTIDGDPYESLNDAIFREGDSGLPKIAAIAATLVGRSVSIIAKRRNRAFHLFVPIWSRDR